MYKRRILDVEVPAAVIFRTCDELAAGRTLINFPAVSPGAKVFISRRSTEAIHTGCVYIFVQMKNKRKKETVKRSFQNY